MDRESIRRMFAKEINSGQRTSMQLSGGRPFKYATKSNKFQDVDLDRVQVGKQRNAVVKFIMDKYTPGKTGLSREVMEDRLNKLWNPDMEPNKNYFLMLAYTLFYAPKRLPQYVSKDPDFLKYVLRADKALFSIIANGIKNAADQGYVDLRNDLKVFDAYNEMGPRVGRPRKNPPKPPRNPNEPARKPGRPRKNPDAPEKEKYTGPPRKRGRPRKIPVFNIPSKEMPKPEKYSRPLPETPQRRVEVEYEPNFIFPNLERPSLEREKEIEREYEYGVEDTPRKGRLTSAELYEAKMYKKDSSPIIKLFKKKYYYDTKDAVDSAIEASLALPQNERFTESMIIKAANKKYYLFDKKGAVKTVKGDGVHKGKRLLREPYMTRFRNGFIGNGMCEQDDYYSE